MGNERLEKCLAPVICKQIKNTINIIFIIVNTNVGNFESAFLVLRMYLFSIEDSFLSDFRRVGIFPMYLLNREFRRTKLSMLMKRKIDFAMMIRVCIFF